ncbi:MAG: FUSC family protein [Mycobacterium sp.]|nr:FUSC family protein [Mycobacterium sp.]
MTVSLAARTVMHVRAALRRLRSVLWPIAQTAVASGLAWFLAHDVVGHRQPFFAPIAAAVCLSASDVLRTQRAVQMIIGVTFGIALGAAVQTVLGAGPAAIAVAVLISLSGAVLIGQGYIAQGLMFFNQITVSATLVIAVSRSGDVLERLADTLIGGGLAIVFAALLFPGNPLKVLHRARSEVLSAVSDVFVHTAQVIDGAATPGWQLTDFDRVNQLQGMLIQARISARQTLLAPRRWKVRERAHRAELQTVRVAVLAGSALHLARVVAAFDVSRLPSALLPAIADLAAAAARADAEPAAAAKHTSAARGAAASLDSVLGDKADSVLAEAVQNCVDDLQQVVDLALDAEPAPGQRAARA